MTHLRTALSSAGMAVCLFTFATAAAAAPPEPDAAPAAATAAAAPAPDVVPAKADEGPTTIGPLPVAPPAPAPDASPADDWASPDTEPESMSGTLFKMLLSLGFIIVLVYVSLNYGLRKLMGVKGMPGRSGLVQVVERVPLDPKRSLFVVRAAGEYLLVGGADNNLNLISRLDPDQVRALLDKSAATAASASPFLQKLLSRQQKPSSSDAAEQAPPSEKV